ncbi:TPA: hypothetical protein SIA35_001720 [Aeromonas sobria]|nr:hypothetical protein [Aeromonas sobria]
MNPLMECVLWNYQLNIEFKRLTDISPGDIIALNSNPLVLRHMPLSDGVFDEEKCRAWVQEKDLQWEMYGYGPWAFLVDGAFAGWGGLQYESGDADLALVLHPKYWGAGKIIYNKIINRAFFQMRLESVTILLPPTRTRVKGVLRQGFKLEGDITIGGERFIRYRLYRGDCRSTILNV